jgi:hypothetical protein
MREESLDRHLDNVAVLDDLNHMQTDQSENLLQQVATVKYLKFMFAQQFGQLQKFVHTYKW